MDELAKELREIKETYFKQQERLRKGTQKSLWAMIVLIPLMVAVVVTTPMFTKASKTNPDHIICQFKNKMRNEHFQQAESLAVKIQKNYPDWFMSYKFLGDSQIMNGKKSEANKNYMIADSLLPDLYKKYNQLLASCSE